MFPQKPQGSAWVCTLQPALGGWEKQVPTKSGPVVEIQMQGGVEATTALWGTRSEV